MILPQLLENRRTQIYVLICWCRRSYNWTKVAASCANTLEIERQIRDHLTNDPYHQPPPLPLEYQ